ncbi:hypothetical protein J2S22_002449 [Rhodoplanes tepidamans]|nr:hypothetical protein [Rhodoplanes tepidamans]
MPRNALQAGQEGMPEAAIRVFRVDAKPELPPQL